jgi:hypothetical protein
MCDGAGPVSAISLVMWMEVLAGADDAKEEAVTRDFLAQFAVRPLDKTVAERAIKIRRQHVIWATAMELGWLLVTRNTKDFPAANPGIRVPYRV